MLGLAFFVGGQLLLVAVIVPVMRGRDELLMRSLAKRFGIGTLVALTVTIATGVAMASHFQRWEDSQLQAKLALLVLIGVLVGLHVATPYTRAISIGVFLSSLAIVWFGVAMTH